MPLIIPNTLSNCPYPMFFILCPLSSLSISSILYFFLFLMFPNYYITSIRLPLTITLCFLSAIPIHYPSLLSQIVLLSNSHLIPYTLYSPYNLSYSILYLISIITYSAFYTSFTIFHSFPLVMSYRISLTVYSLSPIFYYISVIIYPYPLSPILNTICPYLLSLILSPYPLSLTLAYPLFSNFYSLSFTHQLLFSNI